MKFPIFILYLIVINVITFLFMGIDKQKAIKRSWRIRESLFWYLSLIGGAVGVFLGMKIFRHKTKHRFFYYRTLLLGIFHLIIGLYIFLYLS